MRRHSLGSEIAGMKLQSVVFPITDPDLAALSELLHRMTVCQEDTPATRYAGEEIRRLRSYMAKQNEVKQ